MDVNGIQVPDWLTGAAIMWVFGAAIQALPHPDESSGKFYRFMYQFLHLLAANISLVRKTSVDAREDEKREEKQEEKKERDQKR